ncbi:hypothetical protein [Bacillus wiedmannii]|uniref:hypothetical protein n=1 Tax=Bacillus wiedmannii TaxID=1890302 RepID=UPI000D03A180|nr:hypothetical protein [Bacillus wiedmannii]PRT33998.1 hypothetical protein C6358_06780 [Bacillus wiedmannii]PRT45265.1 hypothetical protein C6359_06840 [Bacillus wiedmannii]
MINVVKIEDGLKNSNYLAGELIFMKALSVGANVWQTMHSALYVAVVEMASLLPRILSTLVARGQINVLGNLFLVFYKYLVILSYRKLWLFIKTILEKNNDIYICNEYKKQN